MAMMLPSLVISGLSPAGQRYYGPLKNFVVSNPPVQVPATEFLDSSSGTHRLPDSKGKILLVNFWASWCLACRAEMASLDRLQARLGGGDFEVLAISQDSRKEDATGFLKSQHLTHLRMFFDHDRKLGLAFGQYFLPITILIDRTGAEIGWLVGPAEWDSPQAMAFIRSYISGVDPFSEEHRWRPGARIPRVQ